MYYNGFKPNRVPYKRTVAPWARKTEVRPSERAVEALRATSPQIEEIKEPDTLATVTARFPLGARISARTGTLAERAFEGIVTGCMQRLDCGRVVVTFLSVTRATRWAYPENVEWCDK